MIPIKIDAPALRPDLAWPVLDGHSVPATAGQARSMPRIAERPPEGYLRGGHRCSMEAFVTAARRRSEALALDGDLVEEARSLGVDVARAAEEGVAAAVRSARAERWRAENAGAIEAYNRLIETDGVPLAAFREF